MEKEQAIEFLESLEVGNFLTVNIPIFRDEIIPVTAMFVGIKEDGTYNFLDTGKFALSKDFLQRGKVTLDKEYDGDKAIDIYAKFKMEQEIKKKQKQKNNRDYR